MTSFCVLCSQYIVQRTIKSASEFKGSVVHYVETKPSALRDVLDIHEHDVSSPLLPDIVGAHIDFACGICSGHHYCIKSCLLFCSISAYYMYIQVVILQHLIVT